LLLSACGGGGGGGSSMSPTSMNPNLPTGSSGTALLSWTPATTNTDDTQFSDPAGYRILYGSSPETMTQSVDLTNPGLTSYMVENLPTGTAFFVIMSVNTSGVVGPASPIVSKAVN